MPWCPRSPHARAVLRAARAVVRSMRCRAWARRKCGEQGSIALEAPACCDLGHVRVEPDARAGRRGRSIELDEREDGEVPTSADHWEPRVRRDRAEVEHQTRRLRRVAGLDVGLTYDRARAGRRGRASARSAKPASAVSSDGKTAPTQSSTLASITCERGRAN